MKIKIAWIGKTRQPAIQELTAEYLKRLGHFAEAEGVTLKDELALLDVASGRRSRVKHTLVLLDGRGRQFSSEELAKFLNDYQGRNSMPLLFAVGPADGFSDAARRAAATILSLGKMTLAHDLARIVLLEQLYRAFTVLKGHPYHIGH